MFFFFLVYFCISSRVWGPWKSKLQNAPTNSPREVAKETFHNSLPRGCLALLLGATRAYPGNFRLIEFCVYMSIYHMVFYIFHMYRLCIHTVSGVRCFETMGAFWRSFLLSCLRHSVAFTYLGVAGFRGLGGRR